MTAQAHNRFVFFCVVVVEFAVNGNQALKFAKESMMSPPLFEYDIISSFIVLSQKKYYFLIFSM